MLNLPAGSQHTVRVLLGMDASHAEPAPKPGKKHPVGKRTPKRDGAHGSVRSRHQEG